MYEELVRKIMKVVYIVACLFGAAWVVYRGQVFSDASATSNSLLAPIMTVTCGILFALTAITLAFTDTEAGVES